MFIAYPIRVDHSAGRLTLSKVCMGIKIWKQQRQKRKLSGPCLTKQYGEFHRQRSGQINGRPRVHRLALKTSPASTEIPKITRSIKAGLD